MKNLGVGGSPGESSETRITRLALEEWIVKGSVWPKESGTGHEAEMAEKNREQQVQLRKRE